MLKIMKLFFLLFFLSVIIFFSVFVFVIVKFASFLDRYSIVAYLGYCNMSGFESFELGQRAFDLIDPADYCSKVGTLNSFDNEDNGNLVGIGVVGFFGIISSFLDSEDSEVPANEACVVCKGNSCLDDCFGPYGCKEGHEDHQEEIDTFLEEDKQNRD